MTHDYGLNESDAPVNALEGEDGTPPDPAQLAEAVFDTMMSRDPVPGTGFGSVGDREDVPFIVAAWAIGPAATAELIEFMRGLAERHPTDGGWLDSVADEAPPMPSGLPETGEQIRTPPGPMVLKLHNPTPQDIDSVIETKPGIMDPR